LILTFCLDGFVKVYTYAAEDVRSPTDIKIETELDIGMADVKIEESP
jgi:hypothetical protein